MIDADGCGHRVCGHERQCCGDRLACRIMVTSGSVYVCARVAECGTLTDCDTVRVTTLRVHKWWCRWGLGMPMYMRVEAVAVVAAAENHAARLCWPGNNEWARHATSYVLVDVW